MGKRGADRATNVSEDGEKVGKNNVIGEYEFKNNVEVKFDANGGETPDPSEKYVANGSMYGKLATTKREGYTFSGWYTEKQNGIKIEETTILNNKGDHTLYAHWQANSYTVSFDKNGGETPNPVSKQVRYDDNYGELATTKREYKIKYNYTGATSQNTKESEIVSYIFDGWYKDLEYLEKVEITTKVTTPSSHKLYAKWKKVGTVLPSPKKDGYVFAGWYSSIDYSQKVGDGESKYIPTSNITLYAKWVNNSYIVISNDLKITKQEELPKKLKVFEEFSLAVDRMIAGEYIDTEYEGKQISEEYLEYIHTNKTGALLKLCVRMGAILADCNEDDLKKLTNYAEKIGLAFQIKDDILSEEGDQEILGKPVGNDKEKGKCTYVSKYGLEKAKEILSQITKEAIKEIEDYGEKADFLKELALYIENRNK